MKFTRKMNRLASLRSHKFQGLWLPFEGDLYPKTEYLTVPSKFVWKDIENGGYSQNIQISLPTVGHGPILIQCSYV